MRLVFVRVLVVKCPRQVRWVDISRRRDIILSLDDVELHLVSSMDEVAAFKSWLGERRPINAIALDTETDGFDRIHGKVRLIQFGDGKHGWALDRDNWLGVAREAIDTFEGDFVLHNAPFDTSFLQNSCGIKVPRHRVHDTMVESRINESHMSMALKNQAARHVDAAAAGLQLNLAATGFDWATVPTSFPEYWQYGSLDAVLAYKLHEYHHPIVTAQAPAAYDLEMAVLWVVEKMYNYGTFVDRESAQRYLTELTDYCWQVERWCEREYNVSPGSNAAVVRILADAGFAFTKATKAGAVSLDAEVLQHIDHPLAHAVLGRRQAQKMASTYLRFYVERADENDLIHPSFNTLGARTSRMSCSDPNLQNLPRLGTTKFGDLVRTMIKTRYGTPWLDSLTPYQNATRFGSLITCDYDQIEMRLLAHFAQEPAMIAAFRSEGDFFVNLARQIFQDDSIIKQDKRRQITKNAGYASIYAAGIRKFSQTAGIPESQGREFMGRWNAMYPNVRRFQDTILQLALNRQREEGIAYARSPLTNRRYVADQRKEYALVNYLIQGAAAEVNKMKLIELDSAGIGDYLFATVHDEVLADVPGEHVVDVVHTMQRIMNDNTLFSVPITASASFGERWGKKHEWVEAV